ncbi:hypothetical protein EGW08_018206 [Elysia chlorotica]|uniref:Uncharacterized protein n=1 Tax=Elysia chlorotica TaxID=188477 RepID=A0A3S1H838_ELYCH|nr:hypothetical protein EGW08_018206 [Elysia chlorotica]
MKLTLALCLLALAGVCLAAPTDSNVKKEKHWFNKWVGTVKKFAKEMVEKVNKATNKTANFVHKTAHKIGDKTEDFVEDSVDGIKKAVKYTQKITDKVLGKADDMLDDSVDGVIAAAKYTAKISKKVGKGVVKISRKVYKATYDAAKKSFQGIKELADQVDFDAAVLELVGTINSGLSLAVCDVGCVATSVYFMPAGAVYYSTMACPMLCEGVLAYLEDVAEDLVEESIQKDE